MSSKAAVITFCAVLFLGGCSSKSPSARYGSIYGVLDNFSSHKGYDASKVSKDRASFLKLNPYTVFGKRYYPHLVDIGDEFYGVASWYGPTFHDKPTSNGEIYNMHDFTCAHKTFPMHTMLKVTNLDNGKTTVVRVNDRGPFVGTRIIDLSNAAAREIDMVGAGTANVKLEVVGIHELAHKDQKPTKHSNTKQVQVVKKEQKLQKTQDSLSDTDFSVQIGSFSTIESALAFQELHDNIHGYKSIIKDSSTNERPLLRVCLDGFENESKAREFINSGVFENAYILREQNDN